MFIRRPVRWSSLLCNKYQNSYAYTYKNSYVLQPLPRIDLQPVRRDAYKNRRSKARFWEKAKWRIVAATGGKRAWNRAGDTLDRLIRRRRPKDDARRALAPQRMQDSGLPGRVCSLVSLTPSFIPLFVSHTRSNVVLSSLRPCRANWRAGVDIRRWPVTEKTKERERKRERKRKGRKKKKELIHCP